MRKDMGIVNFHFFCYKIGEENVSFLHVILKATWFTLVYFYFLSILSEDLMRKYFLNSGNVKNYIFRKCT